MKISRKEFHFFIDGQEIDDSTFACSEEAALDIFAHRHGFESYYSMCSKSIEGDDLVAIAW